MVKDETMETEAVFKDNKKKQRKKNNLDLSKILYMLRINIFKVIFFFM